MKKKAKKRELSTVENHYFACATELLSNFVFFGEDMRNDTVQQQWKIE